MRSASSAYSKDQILELYLNKVYFGDGLYGVEAAARGYFGKHASELDVPEAALLAGLVKSPSSYAPTVSLPRATTRRNIVLQAMLEAKALDRAQWEKARAAKVVLRDGLRADEPHGLYFKEQVRRELVDRFGWQRVYQGGLRVFTTIDMPMQVAAESTMADQIKSIEERRAAWRSRLASAQKKTARNAAPAQPPTETNPLQERSSRSNPTPATCGRWSADATSTPATSTGPFRRIASPGRPSSRSCTRRPSRRATRRRP